MKLKNIFSRRNKILLRELVVTDFKLRYQGSLLGYLWSLLKPLLLFTILYIVFVRFLRFGEGIEHFAVGLLLGIVLWTFFVEATTQGMQSIVARGDLIRKIAFPKYIIVISATISALINLLLNMVVVLFFVVLNGVDIQWTIILLPLNIAVLYVFALAIAFGFSVLYVKFRDISHIWEVFLQGLFYATPILYPISIVVDNVGSEAAQILMLSPIATIIQSARYNAISHSTITTSGFIESTLVASIPYAIIVAIGVWAVWIFKKQQKYFAENV